MAVLTPAQINRIKQIINEHFSTFIIENLGADMVGEIDLQMLKDKGLLDQIIPKEDYFTKTYLAGKQRGNLPTIPNKIALDELKAAGLSNQDLKSLEHIRSSAGHYIKNLENTISNQVVTTVLDNNKERSYDVVGEIVKPAFERAVEEGRAVNKIIQELRDNTGDLVRDWQRVVVTELNNAYNHGSIDEIVDRNKAIEKDDILVYCQGPLDERTCQYCQKHYHDGGSFKIYRMSELLAGGTNVGRKAANWQAVVPPMHPNCRHRVVELLPGWTLDESGKQIYVGPDHHELNQNLAKSLKEDNEKLNPSKTQIDRFKRRTLKHIERVKKNLLYLGENTNLNISKLRKIGANHDHTKFQKDMINPYSYINEYYRDLKLGKKVQRPKEVDSATKYHIENESHHPEYHKNINKMDDYDIAEMVSDWEAMAQEVGGTTRDWAYKNIGNRWDFNKKIRKKIYEYIKLFENKEEKTKS